jgi:hypothetical protein
MPSALDSSARQQFVEDYSGNEAGSNIGQHNYIGKIANLPRMVCLPETTPG